MGSLWSVAKRLNIALDPQVEKLSDLPYTISYVIRKRVQIDGYGEIPKEKRPPEQMIWEGSPEEIDNWLDRVLYKKEDTKLDVMITDIEG